VLLILAGACALGVVGTTLRWWDRRRDGLGRPRPFPFVSVSLLAELAALAVVPVLHHAGEEHKLGAVASELAGVRATVHCQTLGEAFVDAGAELGYVRWGPDGVPEHHTLLKHGVCRDLAAYLHSSKTDPSVEQATAVHVLTHESMHMRGITSESAAECAAVQRDARTAELLGASEQQAQAVVRLYWHLIYPDMPDGYRDSECRPGGRLDEHLPDPPW
jgi:hypothetical protein